MWSTLAVQASHTRKQLDGCIAYLPTSIQLIKAHATDRTDRHAIGSVQHPLFAVLIAHVLLPAVFAEVDVVNDVDESASGGANAVWIW